jgi:hypothetical protein
MSSNLLDGELEDILHSTLSGSSGDVYVVNPRQDTIEALVSVGTQFQGTLPSIRLIAEERLLRNVMDDFIVASNAADMISGETLSLRTVEESDANSVVVTDDDVVALVDAGRRMGGIRTEDGSFVDHAREACSETWEEAEQYHLRTPPISDVRETLSTDMGTETREDFSKVLSSLETARGDGDGLDEVTISLLVAAKNEELFYDISRWGEDVGVASKATFSRMKNELEDTGLIETEKVPVDVGRPRQRLTIADERLTTASGDQLASVAESILN